MDQTLWYAASSQAELATYAAAAQQRGDEAALEAGRLTVRCPNIHGGTDTIIRTVRKS